MQGSFSVLKKNCVNFFPGLVAYGKQSSEAFATWLKIYNRGQKYGPKDFVDQAESYTPDFWKKGLSQSKNVWVDKKLSEEVSQKELARLITYKMDTWRLGHAGAVAFFTGGFSVLLSIFWLANDTWLPSTFSLTPEDKKQWREAQDLWRYRSAPSFIMDTKWQFDFHCFPFNAVHERGWEELFEKNDVRRDPKITRAAAEMYDNFYNLVTIRRKALRHMCRAMNFPTFPMLTRLCGAVRVRDYWNLIWNEDYMVITQKLHESMSDEDLFDFAWRRFLAPADKNLSREQLLQRVNDYFEFLGPSFVEEGKTPNVIILTNYCLGYYNDPAYLVEDISALEGNDYEYLASAGKDAFLRRLEFENGPLRDQVEAHTQKLIAERAAKAQQAKVTE